MQAKILIFDIETAPPLVYSWGLFDQNIGIEMIERDPYMLCYSAKFLGEDKIYFDAIWKHSYYKKNPYSDKMIAKSAHDLLSKADIIVGQNVDSFDIKWVNTVFLLNGLDPLPPTKTVDTLKISKQKFKFLSNKLEYVSTRLGFGGKKKHEGFGLWKKCIKGDRTAHREMEEYNKTDIVKTEKIYMKMRSHYNNHVHLPAILDENNMRCVICSGNKFQKRGDYTTRTNTYKRYRCMTCGKWHRGNRSIGEKGEKLLGI